MTKDNIDQTIKEFFKDISFSGIFDREWNKKDPSGIKGWETIRDMHKVWKELNEKGIIVNETNSILIDNEEAKIEENKENAVVIQSISSGELRGSKTDILRQLSKYLIFLAQNYDVDIRKMMEKHPFVDEHLVKELQTLGLGNDSRIGNTMLEIAYINDKEICLTNFKQGMTVKVKLPLKVGIQIEMKMPYSYFLVNKINCEVIYTC